ncbi:MAG TPA: GNAT family N-acetyltransferase [Acidimicrobiales bacterium]|nr:MAG: hypothetical protein B7X07_03055 [Actinobacteria bacterium 21-64-8]HQU00504.1 GNAT family N-acetyltransferase [Acidimicrobiales bacterium]
MHNVDIAREAIETSGALSIFYAAVDELARRYGPGADDRAELLPQLQEPQGFFLVARDEGHLAGGVGLRPIGETTRRLGEVKRLWVRPDLRRRGVADALMSAVVNEAARDGFSELFLETGDRQPEAHALYLKIGWTPIDEFPDGAYSHPGAFRFQRML